MTVADDRIRIATFNWKDNGGRHRHAALNKLAELDIDALLMQELADDDAQLAEAEQVLGMRGTVAGGNRGKLHTGVFLREATFPAFRAFKAERLGRIRPADVTTHLRDFPDVPITFVSLHLSFNSPIDRMREAFGLVPVAEKAEAGQPVIIGGDFNELPESADEIVPPVQWESVSSEVHRGYRAELRDGVWSPITAVDAKLHEFGFCDAAKHVKKRDDKPAALAATAGHEKSAQGGMVRLDRILVPRWMVDVVVDADVVDTGHSDHQLVLVDLSRSAVDVLLNRRRDLLG